MCIGEKMSQSNIDLERSLYHAFDRRDQAAVAGRDGSRSRVSPDRVATVGRPLQRLPRRCPPIFQQTVRIESKVDVERMWEAGNAVIVVGRRRGRVRDSGKAFHVSIAHIWTIRNRKVVSFESFIDTPEMQVRLHDSCGCERNGFILTAYSDWTRLC
jgi:hypothetical protein